MSWEQLLLIRQEAEELARDEITAPPSACPNDGEPLRTGPAGELFCPWGDWYAGT
jgi:hypothetical protein